MELLVLILIIILIAAVAPKLVRGIFRGCGCVIFLILVNVALFTLGIL
ncbi:hypothetical protein [Thalassobacillus sp. C254]|nr:hypothetical protein [Thalassobacillus sp. C254]